MVKYAIVYPGDDVKKFDNHTTSVLSEANKNWCVVYEDGKPNDFKTHRTFVLYSPIQLDATFIQPTRQYGEYYIWDFEWAISSFEYKTFRELLVWAFPMAVEILYFPAPGFEYNWVLLEPNVTPMDLGLFKAYCTYQKKYKATVRQIMTKSYLKKADEVCIIDIQKMISVRQVAEKLWVDISDTYQAYIDRVYIAEWWAPFGDAITFAYKHFKESFEETKKFFINHFQIPFTVVDEYWYTNELSARTIVEWDWFISNGKWYIAGDNKITDFLIRVKYCITTNLGTKKYIVDLIWDTVAEDVEFPNIHTKSGFKQKISAYGPFHFLWADAHINMLHAAVTKTIAPDIQQIVGFWYHDNWNIIATQNCIYNMDKGISYPREWLYYFNRDLHEGYSVVDMQGNLIFISPGLPQIITDTGGHPIEEYLAYFRQFYRDDQGALIFILILWLIYAGVYRRVQEFKFPHIILHGKYWSGKSAISDMIKRAFNVPDLEKWQLKYWETSPFAFLIQCSNRKWLPLFITEFKETNEQFTDAKVSSLLSMFDRAIVSKWLPTQTVVNYHLDALGVIDGEELPKRSALRSRSIIVNVRAENNALSPSEYKQRIQDKILTDLWYDALSRPHYESQYRTYMAECLDHFQGALPWASARSLEIFAAVYAWALMFDESLKDIATQVLTPLAKVNLALEKGTSWVGELMILIQRYAKQLSSNDCYFYDRHNKRFCLRLGNFESFIHRSHLKLTLNIDTINKYFDCVEDVEDPMWWLVNCVIWKVDKDFPRELQFHPEAYQDYKIIKGIPFTDPFT